MIRRSGYVLVAGALVAGITATGGSPAVSAPTPAAAPTLASATSSSHPYSDPVWYPVRDEVQVGCGHSNPGCDEPHDFWTQILTPLRQKPGQTSKAGAFSMGHGIAHVGEANGDACGSGDASFGTWVWVDHGGGTTSRYGHLSQILIREGQRVAPGDALGVMGVTGKRSNDSCFRSYLDFQLKEKGSRGEDYEFPTLLACRGEKVEIWPTAVSGHATWNKTPQGTEMPPNGDDCMPDAVPATVDQPRGVKLKNTKGDKLKASWQKAPSGVDLVRVEFAQYRQGARAYDAPHRSQWREFTKRSTDSTKFKVIDNRKYRVRVHFHTRGAGWSVASDWAKEKSR